MVQEQCFTLHIEGSIRKVSIVVKMVYDHHTIAHKIEITINAGQTIGDLNPVFESGRKMECNGYMCAK